VPPTCYRESANGLFWTSVGVGAPIIAVHGAMGFDHSYFRPWLDNLAEHARIVYLDLSGCGASPSTDEISLERWADDVEAVREAAGCERVTVFGHSMSTWIALQYARRWPEHTAGIILCNGAPVFDYTQDIIAAAAERLSPAQLADFETISAARTFDDATFRRLFLSVLPLYFHRYEDAFGARIALPMRFDARVYLHARDSYLTGYDCTPSLESIEVRTLVLTGRDDVITPPECAAVRLVERLPNATLHVFEESGHFPFIEEPEAFTRVVVSWLGGN